jgi:oligopeptide/dipeptide ABC transporter ATP-binding protein
VSRLELKGVTVRYRGPGASVVEAVDGASLEIGEHEMLGLVGESGCGKTTLGRAILGLVPLSAGEIRWRGRRIDGLGRRTFRPLRRELQYIFQDPHACFDPRMTVAESVAEPLRALERETPRDGRERRALERLAEVGIGAALASRYPHQLSGGQLQRAGLARALVVDPRFVVCDEPVSALDVPVQAQVLGLLERIRDERGLAGLFISHNLAVVARLCARVCVMFSGRLVESGPRREIVGAPLHPYTRELLDAVPRIDPEARVRSLARVSSAVSAAGPEAPVGGCAFARRCPHALPRCRTERPLLREAAPGRHVACHRAEEWPDGLPPDLSR